MDILSRVEQWELIPDNLFDKIASRATFFTLIVVFQGCFGGMGVAQTPAALSNAVNSPVFRFIFVSAIAYTATSDIENAVVCTLAFFIFLHMIRTDEERKEVPMYV